MAEGNLQERILSWVVRLVSFLRTLPRDRVTSALVSQLVRSGTSIGANYAESQCGASRRDFGNFVRHALKSGRESEYWLAVVDRTATNVAVDEISWLRGELNELVRMLYAIVRKIG